MDVTLDKILGSGCLKGARVLAGGSRLDRVVSAVTVGEVPDIADWLSGGELVLSTFFAAGKDTDAQVKFASNIIGSRASGLIFKPDRFVKALPKGIVALADEMGFPIVEVPVWVRWTSVISQVAGMLAMTEAELKLRGGFLDGILSGGLSADEIQRQAKHLGGDLSRGCYVLLAEIDSRQMPDPQILECFFETGNSVTKTECPDSVVVPQGGGFVAFVAPAQEASLARQSLDKLALRLQAMLRGLVDGATVSIGVSSFCTDLNRLHAAYGEAEKSLVIKRRLGERGSIACFEDMTIYRILLRLAESDMSELKMLYQKTLEPLIVYDRRHRTNLLKTIETFLARDENVTETARELFTHRHTVRYRLKRASEITGLDLSRTDEREKLGLALKVMRLFYL